MIRRLNAASFAPACLGAGAATAASKERAKAKAHYQKVPPPTSAYPFEVYGRAEVKNALAALFGGKCAYCEYRIEGAPFDVEHYRPKGGVLEDDGTMSGGYWWLASEWSNLLPACQDCNRARYHPVPGGGEAKFGKENRFPLLGTPRSTALGGEAAEAPALLNPTVDDPRPHLAFSIRPQPDGHDGSVVSLLTARGVGTDEVVGLNRPRLVRARMERITSLRFALRSIEKEWKLAKLATGVPERAAALAVASEETEEVWTHFLKWDAPFSAACRADYRRWRADILAMMAA